MKPITVLAVSLVALLLPACSVGPQVPVKNIGALPPAEKEAVISLPIYNDAQLAGKSYTIIRIVEGISCKNKTWDPAATKTDAINQAKYWAKESGADAIMNIQCDPPRGPSDAYNCWESVTCTAQAVRLSQR